MSRFVDRRDSTDPVSAEAARLVLAAAPPPAPPGRKDRVLARLAARPVAAPWQRLLVRASVSLVIGCVVALALLSSRHHTPGVSPPSAATVAPTVPVERPPAPVVAPVAPVAPTAPVPAPASPSRPASKPRAHALPPPAPAAAPVASTTVARPEPNPTNLIFDATLALRRQHDPARALVLLAEYGRREPAGEMLEECLALVVEAKSTLGRLDAVASAKDYLERFPQGRFREQALRVVRDHEEK